MLKMILACEIFPPDIGGPATYAVQLADALERDGHKVKVISYGEVKKSFSFSLTLVSRRIPFFLRQIVYFLKLLSLSRGSNLIYAQGPSVGPAAVWVRRFWKIPVVVKFVGDQSWQQIRMKGGKVAFEDYMRAYGKHWYDLKTFWIQRWQKFSLREADRIIVPSQYLKKIVTEYLGADEKRVTVIPNGVEVRTEILHNQRHCEEGFANEAISGNACINEIATLPDDRLPDGTSTRNDILFVGRFENWKGLDTLIDVLKLLPRDFTLTLVGDGSEKKNLESRIENRGLQDRVNFVGRIPHSELEKYFSEALCFYEGSQYEGMPHVVLESWSFGIPVIVSDFPANIELVRDGETGLVFKLGDPKDLANTILRLSKDKDLWSRISGASFEEHKKYDKNKVMERVIDFLTEVING